MVLVGVKVAAAAAAVAAVIVVVVAAAAAATAITVAAANKKQKAQQQKHLYGHTINIDNRSLTLLRRRISKCPLQSGLFCFALLHVSPPPTSFPSLITFSQRLEEHFFKDLQHIPKDCNDNLTSNQSIRLECWGPGFKSKPSHTGVLSSGTLVFPCNASGAMGSELAVDKPE